MIIKFSSGSRIKNLRKNKGLTQVAFAIKMNEAVEKYRATDKPVTSQTISNIECNKCKLSMEIALAIAITYCVSLDWLFLRKDADQILSDMQIESIEKCISSFSLHLKELREEQEYKDVVIVKLSENDEKTGVYFKKDTQLKFAKKIDIAQSISNYELGESLINSEVAQQIANEYGVSLNWLFGLSNKKLSSSGQASLNRVKKMFEDGNEEI